jgi:hypothetical protein
MCLPNIDKKITQDNFQTHNLKIVVFKLSDAFFPTLFGVSYGERKALIRMIKVPAEPNLEDWRLLEQNSFDTTNNDNRLDSLFKKSIHVRQRSSFST